MQQQSSRFSYSEALAPIAPSTSSSLSQTNRHASAETLCLLPSSVEALECFERMVPFTTSHKFSSHQDLSSLPQVHVAKNFRNEAVENINKDCDNFGISVSNQTGGTPKDASSTTDSRNLAQNLVNSNSNLNLGANSSSIENLNSSLNGKERCSSSSSWTTVSENNDTHCSSVSNSACQNTSTFPIDDLSTPCVSTPRLRDFHLPSSGANVASSSLSLNGSNANVATASNIVNSTSNDPHIDNSGNIAAPEVIDDNIGSTELTDMTEKKCLTGRARNSGNNISMMEYPDHLVCAICLELLYNPFSLKPCLHVYCESCLRRLASPAPTNTLCPLCRNAIGACMPAAGMISSWYFSLDYCYFIL